MFFEAVKENVGKGEGRRREEQNICGKIGVQVYFKCTNTVSELLVAHKDRQNICSKGGVIYRYICDHPVCTMEYIGETGRNFGDRYKKHLRNPAHLWPFPNYKTSHQTGNLLVVGRESQGITRMIKEVMYIRVNDPPLNKNLSKYQLTQIWDWVLWDTTAVCLQ